MCCVVVIAVGKRPVSIPNPEAKTTSADGTALQRVWETKTPPHTQPPQPPTLSFFIVVVTVCGVPAIVGPAERPRDDGRVLPFRA